MYVRRSLLSAGWVKLVMKTCLSRLHKPGLYLMTLRTLVVVAEAVILQRRHLASEQDIVQELEEKKKQKESMADVPRCASVSRHFTRLQ